MEPKAPSRRSTRRTEGPATDLASRLSDLREQHKLSIRKLAREAGVSASMLSEVERGLVEPSIGILKRIAEALDVPVLYFFSTAGASGETVIRSDERRELESVKGVRYQVLVPDHVRTLEPIHAELQPGAGMDDEPLVHEGEEWGLVIQGRLKVWVGAEAYVLDVGDAIYITSSVPHRVGNPTDEVAKYLWVNSPASF